MLKVLVVLLALILVAAVGLLFLLGQQETPPEPTPGPTTAPTSKPTEAPTNPPTDAPTQAPTQEPTEPPYTGWQEIDGNTYYLVEDVPCTGIVTIEEVTYCFGSDGALIRENWLDSGDKRYYADENGQITVGWLKLDNNRYYFLEDGTMARGKVKIQKETSSRPGV
jgi:glucan-binding YG repeat protein